MNDDLEDALDVLLRQQFEGPIPDDGFCKRVMQRLPARRHRHTWPILAGTLSGIATCSLSFWFAPMWFVGFQDWLAGELSEPLITLFILTMSMAILTLAWTLSEAGDEFNV